MPPSVRLLRRPREGGDELVALSPSPDSGAEELVAGLIARRPTAVAECFDRHAGAVRRVLSRTLGSVDVDDLCQETFLTVLRRVHTLSEPAALRSFILGTAVRLGMNELRKRKVRRFVGLSDDAPLPMIAPHDAIVAEQVRAVYGALDRLDATSRSLFVLRRVEQLELTELAQVMGCSLSTLKRKLARAEQRFSAIAEQDPRLSPLLGGRDA